MLRDLINFPQIKPIHSLAKLSHMSEFKCYNILEAVQLENQIQNRRENHKHNLYFSVDHKYKRFHETINL